MVVHGGLGVTRACLESLKTSTEPFALAVVDNGSRDDTPTFFGQLAYPFPVRYYRNADRGPVLAAYNEAWRLADTEYVCLLHNDTEMLEPGWLTRLLAPHDRPDTGLTGLYGAKRVGRDGGYGRGSIVHSLADGATVRAPYEEVAAVDGVCLCLRRSLLEQVGGIDEGYGCHGYDRDLSFAVRERGRRCLVVHAPFRHGRAGTGDGDFATPGETESQAFARRRSAMARFARKFAHRLPSDVRSMGTRVADWLARQT
jgi:GT2 family glycosyltransferase